MGRILAIDFGTVRIGVALSDERKILATPHPKIEGHKDLKIVATRILALCAQNNVEKIIIGLPLLLSGNDSSMTVQVRKLEEILKAETSIPILLWDERLSSAQIEKSLKGQDVSRKKRAPIVDSLSAALVLQNYLDSLSFSRE